MEKITIYLTDKEKEEIENQSNKIGLRNVSSFCRLTILEKLKKEGSD